MRAVYRQPIYLAKLKKRDKQNAVVQDFKPIDSIQYDLMLFQESLHFKNQPRIDLPITMRSTSMSTKPLGENSKILNQTVEVRNMNMQNKKKLNGDAHLRSTAPVFQKCMFNKNNFELKNVHKTQASTKPKTKTISETCLNIIQNKNQSNELSYLKMGNPMANTNVSQPKTKTIAEKMGNSQLKELILVKYNETNQKNSEGMKKIYQKKIEQLQQLNTKNIEIIKKLQQINHFHSSQNGLLLQRIQHIQHEFDQLLINNNSLKDLETTQEKTTETIVLKFFSQQSSQTEQVLENQSRQQTFARNINHSSRASLQLSNQDWIMRAKQLKNQLQLQKIHTLNLQASFKIQLQNQQIEWRQKMEAMQRQFQGLNTRYQRKCTEVKQKQQLITRLIQK